MSLGRVLVGLLLAAATSCGTADEPFTNDRDDPLALGELCRDLAAYEDGHFWVLGRLVAVAPVCTAAGCRDSDCCNSCDGRYALPCDRPVVVSMTDEVPGGPAGDPYYARPLVPGYTRDGCVGNECAVEACSHGPVGGEVLLRVRLVRETPIVRWSYANERSSVEHLWMLYADRFEQRGPAVPDAPWTAQYDVP